MSAEWQPIETASKDGTYILGWSKYFGEMLVTYSDPPHGADRNVCWVEKETRAFIIPTHWLPLPPPPEPEAE